MPGLVPGIHVLLNLNEKRRGWPGHRRAEATPSFRRLCPAMTKGAATHAGLPKRNARRDAARIARPYFLTHIMVTTRSLAASCGGLLAHATWSRLMLDGLRQFIADVVSPGAHGNRSFDDTGYRLAATALLVHVISIDGEPSAIEKRKLHGLLETHFALDPGERTAREVNRGQRQHA